MTTATTLHTTTTAPTQFIDAGEVTFAYRRFGTPAAKVPPLVFVHHFMGTMDTHDPAVVDALATGREVILFDNAGVGRSTGRAPSTIAEMAIDAARFIDALGLARIDILGFSMGGHITQQLCLDRPELIRRIVLVGTGPRGGEGMAGLAPDVAPLFEVTLPEQNRMWLPIFFSPSPAAQAAGERYLQRIGARTEDFDVPVAEITVGAQGAALGEWGLVKDGGWNYCDRITQPALVVNGSLDIIIPTVNSFALQQLLPDAELVLYPDSNHASHFQYPGRFSRHATDFLSR